MSRECKHECHRDEHRLKGFPDSIKDLLCLLSKDDGNRVTVITNSCEDCIQENVEIVSVIGDLAIFRCHDKFKFIKICCICEIIVDCETIVDEVLDSHIGHC